MMIMSREEKVMALKETFKKMLSEDFECESVDMCCKDCCECDNFREGVHATYIAIKEEMKELNECSDFHSNPYEVYLALLHYDILRNAYRQGLAKDGLDYIIKKGEEEGLPELTIQIMLHEYRVNEYCHPYSFSKLVNYR